MTNGMVLIKNVSDVHCKINEHGLRYVNIDTIKTIKTLGFVTKSYKTPFL